MPVTDIEIYAKHFFSDELTMTHAHVPASTQERLTRMRAAYTYWKRFPQLADKEIKSWLRDNYSIAVTTAEEDVSVVKALLGNFNKETKDWKVYMFNQHIMEIYRKAKAAGDYKSAEKALADYAKYNRLDKDEEVPDNWWERIMPQQFNPTADPRTIGINPIPNLGQHIAKWNKQFREELIDADFEEVQEAARYAGETEKEEQ